MRKLLATALLGFVLLVATASPALAVRDPFDPVISPAQITGTGTAGTTETGTAGTATGTGTTNVLAENGSETLANTGADTEPWLVAAFALIATGAAAVVLSKVNSRPTA